MVTDSSVDTLFLCQRVSASWEHGVVRDRGAGCAIGWSRVDNGRMQGLALLGAKWGAQLYLPVLRLLVSTR